MRKPIVAVVGRPNVGKSTFFNRISGKRISIVEDTPGVTRDRIYTDVNWLKYNFTMIDTGGIEPNSDDVILSQMRQQAMIAVDSSDVILFMIDGRANLTSADEDVAEILRRSQKPVILVANKIDTGRLPEHFYDYYTLGMGEPIAISSVNGLNLGDLLDEIVSHFKDIVVDDYDEDTTKVAIIGKPNAGKSSLVNNILGEERVIVSEIAGTTREAIDTPFTMNDKDYVLIDTAGLRRKSKIDDNVERYSMFRALTAIERADVCVLMIDAVEGVTEQDKKVAGYAHEAGKATIILVNKWDLIEKNNNTYKEYTKIVRNELAFMQYAPIEFVSVKSGQRLVRIMEMIDYVDNQASLRVPTGTLNDVISEAIMMHQPPSDKGKRLKIYYMTQIGVKPPTFVLFINDNELAHFSYIRYLENHIRKNFNFDGTPIIIKTNEKKQ
jgi:GTP-binding protein